MLVHASTQDPTEVQHIVARILGVPDAFVTRRDAADGRRLRRQGKPGLRLGGDRRARRPRHRRAVQGQARPRRRFRADRQAPRFPRRLARRLRRCRARSASTKSSSTRAAAARPTFRSASSTARCSTPPTPIGSRPSRIASRRLKTNTVSNTAFRGFGGPQGMLAIERVIDGIARERGLDPLDVRKANFYRPGGDSDAVQPDRRGSRDAARDDRGTGSLQRLSRAARARSRRSTRRARS